MKRSPKKPVSRFRRWLHRGFLVWSVVATAGLFISFNTRGVDARLLKSDGQVRVTEDGTMLSFVPVQPKGKTALLFLCGSGVMANAYAPLLRPVATAGFSVYIVKLPLRFAPTESHKEGAILRVFKIMSSHAELNRWVVSGHSLGAALACRVAQASNPSVVGLVLVGTTHPKEDDLSSLAIPVTKVYGTNDGVAPMEKVMANKHLLPKSTRWVEIRGANHAQFGHYGRQLLDGGASISREDQQAQTRTAILDLLQRS